MLQVLGTIRFGFLQKKSTKKISCLCTFKFWSDRIRHWHKTRACELFQPSACSPDCAVIKLSLARKRFSSLSRNNPGVVPSLWLNFLRISAHSGYFRPRKMAIIEARTIYLRIYKSISYLSTTNFSLMYMYHTVIKFHLYVFLNLYFINEITGYSQVMYKLGIYDWRR